METIILKKIKHHRLKWTFGIINWLKNLCTHRKRLLFLWTVFSIHHMVIAQDFQSFDLHQLLKNNKISVYNRDVNTIQEDKYQGIKLSKHEGEGIAWINDVDFSNGIIEFDVRGENVKQNSFVGIAFHGLDNETFDAIYLRPFQFKEADPKLRRRGIQYISLPEFTWRKLRELFPEKYENEVISAPDPDSWIKMRVVIDGSLISVFIDNDTKPVLIVTKLTSTKSGKLGFYTGDTSGGDFANLRVIKK